MQNSGGLVPLARIGRSALNAPRTEDRLIWLMSSATVGAVIMSRTETDTPRAFSRVTSWTTSIEWPPSRKKSSSGPTAFHSEHRGEFLAHHLLEMRHGPGAGPAVPAGAA